MAFSSFSGALRLVKLGLLTACGGGECPDGFLEDVGDILRTPTFNRVEMTFVTYTATIFFRSCGSAGGLFSRGISFGAGCSRYCCDIPILLPPLIVGLS
jgi:hypothetical protein